MFILSNTLWKKDLYIPYYFKFPERKKNNNKKVK